MKGEKERERERMVRAQDVVFAHVKMAPKEEEPIFLSLTSCALMPEMEEEREEVLAWEVA